MGYKSRFFAMVAAALLVVSLPSAGYAAGQTEKELARQIQAYVPGSSTHLRAHETEADLVCRLLLEKKKGNKNEINKSLINKPPRHCTN